MGPAFGTKTSLALLISLLLLALSAACGKGSPAAPSPPSSPPPSGLTFKGSTSLGSQRLAGVEVSLSGDSIQSRETDANGEFEFSGISGSHFIVTPLLVGYTFSPSNYELGGQSRSDLNFTAQRTSNGTMVGETAVDFSAKNQNGQNVSLYEYFGKVVLVNFSADWCAPCRDEAGHLEKLFQDYKDKGFQIITLLTSGSPAEWANEYKLTFPVLDDGSQRVWFIYGEGWLPLNIILDRKMTIRYKQADYFESAIIDTIEKYL